MVEIDEKCIGCLYMQKRRCILEECFLEIELKEKKVATIKRVREKLKQKKRLRHC